MSGASVDYSHPRPCSGAKTLRRHRNRVDTDNVVLIDVDDSDGFDNVIIIDVPESLGSKYQSSRVLRKDTKGSWATVICLDDDENYESNTAHTGAKVDRGLDNGASTSKSFHHVPGNVGSSLDGFSDDCEFIQENMSPLKLSKGKRTYSGIGTSDIDCELMEDSFCIREQWEKASWKRKCDTRNGQSGIGDPQVVPNEGHQNVNVVNEHDQHEENFFMEKDNKTKDTLARPIQEENGKFKDLICHGEGDLELWRDILSKMPPFDNGHSLGSQQFEKGGSSSYDRNEAPLGSVFDKDVLLDDQDDLEGWIMGEREKLKETEEYKKALAEELASRQEALRVQAEAAQNLRRLRKRERVESNRLLDMERRQKQRIEEIRETQKKDVEDMNLKEGIRASVRKELDQLEQSCHSMASLLQGLGVLGYTGSQPLPNEVRLAYKKALLTFHPDRASRADMRQQVEAEEKFKLISRMKEKFKI